MTFDASDRDDAPLEPRLAGLAREYHQPAADPPRDAMWAAIAAERARRRAGPRVFVIRHWRLGLGIAALLLLGIGLGRWSASLGTPRGPAALPPPPTAANGAAEGGAANLAFTVAATQVLTRSEVLLTSFRARRGGATDAQFLASARDLLALTRLMQDSPAAADPALRTLLEDLELVLAQIVQLAPGTPSPEAELITQGMTDRALLPRLRTAIPAGPAAVGPAGAL